VCASAREAKNLVKVESRTKAGLRGATIKNGTLLESFPEIIRGKIVEFAVKRLNQGYTEIGVKTYIYSLRSLIKNGADLNDPESVKNVISNMKVSNKTKNLLVEAYGAFLKFLGGSWLKPKYAVAEKLPFIPLETEIDQLIAGCSKTVAAFLQVLKDTGARRGEALRLEWNDIDSERGIISINKPEKGSNSRQIKVSDKTLTMLKRLPKRNKRIFKYSTIQKEFYYQRKRIAHKLGNPRILSISFHTLRHWKGTMEYHKTKDIMHVKYMLGHKNIKNTLLYVNLENVIFQNESDEYHVKVARTPDEIEALLEVGFEYVCEKDGLLFFRKRK